MELIKIENIKTHELNPNAMSKADIKKLTSLIKEENNYPPLIVNKKEDGTLLLLDGHQRLKVLKDLGYTDIKCDIWNVDEKTELILLSTLNKLKGKSIKEKKDALFEELSRHMDKEKIIEIAPERKDYFADLYNMVNIKDKALDDFELEDKIMFSCMLDRDKYKEVLDFIDTYLSEDKKEESVFWLVSALKSSIDKAYLKQVFSGRLNGNPVEQEKQDTQSI